MNDLILFQSILVMLRDSISIARDSISMTKDLLSYFRSQQVELLPPTHGNQEVTMKLSPNVINNVSRLIKITGEQNKAQLVADSINFYTGVRKINNCCKIIVEYNNGDRYEWKF